MPISHAESALFFIPSNGRCFTMVSFEFVLISKTVNIVKVKTTKMVRYTDNNGKQHKMDFIYFFSNVFFNERTNIMITIGSRNKLLPW